MFFVYILQSKTDQKRLYTGFTQNIKKRIIYHNSGNSPHTSKYKPWEIIYFSAFSNKQSALNFERYLKTSSGIAFRNKRLI